MRWVPDRTGRFLQRPHYDPEELDGLCEDLVTSFLHDRYGSAVYPIRTDDLTVMIERVAQDLDVYADLSSEGRDVEGLTDFVPGEQPKVRIARELSEQPWRENRLRTTLTHELGHVVIHGRLYSGAQRQPSLFESSDDHRPSSPRCRRGGILTPSNSDWMEWQAAYASGPFLMPRASVYPIVETLLGESGASCPLSVLSPEGQTLMERVRYRFSVSPDAARIRLMQLNYLVEAAPSASLF